MSPRSHSVSPYLVLPALVIFIALVASAPFASAIVEVIPEHIVPCGTSANPEPCTLCHMGVLVINLANFFMYAIALPATALLVAAGGIIILTAGPSEERLKSGKKILTNTLVGVIIIFLAWIAVDTIIKVLTGNIALIGTPTVGQLSQQFGPWNIIDPSNCPL